MTISRDVRRFLITIVVGLAAAFTVYSARADSFQLHIASEHASGCDTCNERNTGIGYMGGGSGTRLAAGYYKNSWFKDSFYAGPNWHVAGPISFSLVGITGYQGTAGRSAEILVVPLTHVTIDVYKHTGVMFTYAPTQDGGVTLLSLNIRF